MQKTRKISLVILFSSLIAIFAPNVLAVEPQELAQVENIPPVGTPERRVPGATRQTEETPPGRPRRLVPGASGGGVSQQQIIYNVPRNLGKPARRVPGTSRGTTCLQGGAKVLTALVPERNPILTTSKYPSFLFYVPKTSAKAMEFVLHNDNDDIFYRATFKNTGQPGVITISLPAYSSLPPLEIGKEYNWSFTIICDEQIDTNPTLEGSIKRIQTPQQLQIGLDNAQMRERAVLYGQAGFWENTLTTLVQLRQQNPTNLSLKTDWENLLKSVGLGAIAPEPLIGE